MGTMNRTVRDIAIRAFRYPGLGVVRDQVFAFSTASDSYDGCGRCRATGRTPAASGPAPDRHRKENRTLPDTDLVHHPAAQDQGR